MTNADPFVQSDLTQFVGGLTVQKPTHAFQDAVIRCQGNLDTATKALAAVKSSDKGVGEIAAAELSVAAAKDALSSAQREYDTRRIVDEKRVDGQRQQHESSQVQSTLLQTITNATALKNVTNDARPLTRRSSTSRSRVHRRRRPISRNDDIEAEIRRRDVKRLEEKVAEKRQAGLLQKLVEQQKRQIMVQEQQAQVQREALRVSREQEMRREVQAMQQQMQQQVADQQRKEQMKMQLRELGRAKDDDEDEEDDPDAAAKRKELKAQLAEMRQKQLDQMVEANKRVQAMQVPPTASPMPTASPAQTTEVITPFSFTPKATPQRTVHQGTPSASDEVQMLGFMRQATPSRSAEPTASPKRTMYELPVATASEMPRATDGTVERGGEEHTETFSPSVTFSPSETFSPSAVFTESSTFVARTPTASEARSATFSPSERFSASGTFVTAAATATATRMDPMKGVRIRKESEE